MGCPQLLGQHRVTLDNGEDGQGGVDLLVREVTEFGEVEVLVLQRVGHLMGNDEPFVGRQFLPLRIGGDVQHVLFGDVQAQDLLRVQLLEEVQQVDVERQKP
jgi:hypothetical protein